MVASKDSTSFRTKVKIAIIDDEGVPPVLLSSLRSRNFNVQDFEDIENVDQLAAYNVIISDINGVATKIDPQKQGLALIYELHRSYPQKALAIYSGSSHKLPDLPEAVRVIDKDSDIDTWARIIDGLIQRVSDPIILWKLVAHKLIESGIPAGQITCVEDDYVCRIVNNQSFDGFPIDENSLGAEAIGVLRGIITESIIKLIIT